MTVPLYSKGMGEVEVEVVREFDIVVTEKMVWMREAYERNVVVRVWEEIWEEVRGFGFMYVVEKWS